MKVKIFGRLVPVRKQKDLAQDHGCLAYYNYEDHAITMDSELSKEEALKTLIHEMVHALFDRAGLHQTQQITEGVEEVIAEQISTIMVENFRLTLKTKA